MKKILLLLGILISLISSAQTIDDVTLIVVGTGNTKEKAVNNALRSAIEQAFGVFVSANTEIVNDELVKDEIATVTSGNIKSYKELSVVSPSDGAYTVSLEAIVSTKTLAVYAKSHGSSCEFAGVTFGANLKLAKLNKINTEKVFENLIKQCKEIIPYTFEPSLEVGNPTANGDVPITINLYSTPGTYQLSDLLISTISALKLDGQEITQLKEMKIETYFVHLNFTSFREGATIEPGIHGSWSCPYSIDISLHAPFPSDQFCKALENALFKYCIKDNFNNTYPINFNHIVVSDGVKRCGADTSGAGVDTFSIYSFCKESALASSFSQINEHSRIIRLPYGYLRPTVSRKTKEISYPRKLIGKYSFTLNIPVETLSQITSFEVTIMD